ncbi:MAG: hypothetical protein ACP5MD_15125, partial [Verrucomicrobiia bacterium]
GDIKHAAVRPTQPTGLYMRLECDVAPTEKSAHIDFFPTLAELAGASLRPEVQAQVEGRSLLALLTAENTSWPDRMLVTHLGRWEYNQATAAKYRQCAIRNSRFKLRTLRP